MAVKRTNFLDSLTRSQLVSHEVLARLNHDRASNRLPVDDKALASELVKEHSLTRFQAEEILEGNYRNLQIGPYILLDLVGLGGMGAVYKAVDSKTGRHVALKVLAERFQQDPGIRARFRLEAKAGMQLRHPSLAATFCRGQTDDVFGNTDYMVMEWIAGASLQEMAMVSGPLPMGQACDVIMQAAQGLQVLHDQGMIHRDVKPENVIVLSDGRAKVLDFGLALAGTAAAEEEFSLAMIFGHDRLGTIDYISPEQAENSLEAVPQSDMYSLGCTLYAVLAASFPFPNANRAQTLEAHKNQPPPSIREIRPKIPVELDALIRRLMAKSPGDRFESMTAVAAALQPFAKRTPIKIDLQELAKLRRENEQRRKTTLTASRVRRSTAGLSGASTAGGRGEDTPRPEGADNRAAAAARLGSVGQVGGNQRPVRKLRDGEQLPQFRLVRPDGTTVVLTQKRYVIGRGKDCEISWNSADLAIRHCRLAFDGAAWNVTDMTGKCGIAVNGDPVTERVLKPGDLITLASAVTFRLELNPMTARKPILKWPLIGAAVVVALGLLWYVLH